MFPDIFKYPLGERVKIIPNWESLNSKASPESWNSKIYLESKAIIWPRCKLSPLTWTTAIAFHCKPFSPFSALQSAWSFKNLNHIISFLFLKPSNGFSLHWELLIISPPSTLPLSMVLKCHCFYTIFQICQVFLLQNIYILSLECWLFL